jgi:hypothetical protein
MAIMIDASTIEAREVVMHKCGKNSNELILGIFEMTKVISMSDMSDVLLLPCSLIDQTAARG